MIAAPDPPDDGDIAAYAALLRWYVAMGVDAPIGETARDAFGEPDRPDPKSLARPAPPPLKRAGTALAAGPATSGDALIAQAQALAAEADTLDDLGARWTTLPGCSLATTASRMLFAGGNAGAPLMLVGGAPDSDDERQGEVFCGAKGQLLDAMLRAIGLDRSRVYLSNVLPWRPPGNRAPTPLELALCLPFARRQVALAAPVILVCLGERAAQPLLNSREPISRLRGRWLSFEGEAHVVKATVTFSLDYLLKQPLAKKRAWSDLQMIAAAL